MWSKQKPNRKWQAVQLCAHCEFCCVNIFHCNRSRSHSTSDRLLHYFTNFWTLEKVCAFVMWLGKVFFGMHTTFHAAKFKTLFYCQWNDERKTGKKVEKFLLSFIWRILFGHGNHVHWIIFVYWNFWIITVITCLSESQFACVWLNAARVIIH